MLACSSLSRRVHPHTVNDDDFEDEEKGTSLVEGPGTRTRGKLRTATAHIFTFSPVGRTTGSAGRPGQIEEAATGEEYETAEYDNQGEPQGKSRGAMSGQLGEKRVLGGYKAALKSTHLPNFR